MDKKYAIIFILLIVDTTIAYSYSIDDLEKVVSSKDYVMLDSMLGENNENIDSPTNSQGKFLLLQIAIRNKDVNSIIVLLKHGADLHKSNKWAESVFQGILDIRDDSIMRCVCSQDLSYDQLLKAFNVSVGSGNVKCAELLLSSEKNKKLLNSSNIYFYNGLVISPPLGKHQGYYNYPRNGREILKLLISNGFDPYIEQPGMSNAVDLAYTYKDIEALMLLDVKDKYKEYKKSFIPDVKSPFLGSWTNNKDGFRLVKISFGNEGRASVFISIGSMEHYWRMTDINKAEILTPIYQDSVKNDELTCIYNQSDDSVTFNLNRMGEEEIIKLIREENSNKSSSH